MFPLDCFFRRQLSPEHVTWSTAKVMSRFQLERRAEGLALSQADWRRINVGLTTTWSDSNGQICVAAVLNAQLFCFLSSSMQSAVVCARQEEEDGLRRLPAAGATGGLPLQSIPSLSTEAGSCCRVEVDWSDWSSGRDLGPEPQDEIQRGAKVEKPGRFTVSFRAALWTVFQAFKNLPPLLQIYTQWTVLLQPLAFFASDANRGQQIPSSHLPHLSCAFTSVANGPSTSTQEWESHHHAGISNWPEGFLMVAPSVLIKIWMIHPLSLTYERQGDVWLVRLFRNSQNTFRKHFN